MTPLPFTVPTAPVYANATGCQLHQNSLAELRLLRPYLLLLERKPSSPNHRITATSAPLIAVHIHHRYLTAPLLMSDQLDCNNQLRRPGYRQTNSTTGPSATLTSEHLTPLGKIQYQYTRWPALDSTAWRASTIPHVFMPFVQSGAMGTV